ncbi:MAG: threonine ammonia-lyase [Acidimicrobiia bacterium]|nr:threonine ammonia-lyase [Acidimicrobiia bacterium]
MRHDRSVHESHGPDVDIEDVLAARRIADLVERTPSARSRTLSAITGAEVVVKFENLQFTGSFKDRGAANRLLALDKGQRRRGVVAASAGNHAQGVAYHAQRLGIPATIVMPVTAPLTKVANTAQLGATVVQHGATVSEAASVVEGLLAEGLTLVHPYDDPLVVAGQGTVGLELLADHPDLDVVVVPVGGGGLCTGVALAAAGIAPRCRVLGVQTERYPHLVCELEGRPVPPQAPGTSLADGIAVKAPGAIALHQLPRLGVDLVTVPESRIEEAVGLLLEVEKTVAEGAGAVPLAALLEYPGRFGGLRVGLVLSGGNIDPRLLASVVLRSLVRQGRLTRMRVETDDLPGSLGRIATAVGDAGGNLVEVVHERLLGGVPARRVDIDLLVETLDRAHLERVVQALRDLAHTVEILDVGGR